MKAFVVAAFVLWMAAALPAVAQQSKPAAGAGD